MNPRIENFNKIISYANDHHIRLNRFWGSFIETARFKLGESIKDIKIPFSMDSDSTDAITEAISDLLHYLKKRQEAQLKMIEEHSIDDFTEKDKIAAKTFQIRFHRPETMEHQIVSDLLFSDSILDAGIFETWFLSKGSGSKFLKTLHGILHKALVEEIKSEHLEKTSYIANLALIRQLLSAKSLVKKTNIKGIKYEQLDITVGNILFHCLDKVKNSVISQLNPRIITPQIEHSFLLLNSSCHPLTFTAIKQSITKSPINPYRMSQGVIDALDPLYREISSKNTDLNFVAPAMIKKILGSSKLKKIVLEEASLVQFRDHSVEFLIEADSYHLPIAQKLREFTQDPGKIHDLFRESKALDSFANSLKGILKKESKMEKKYEILLPLEDLIRFVQKGSAGRNKNLLNDLIEKTISRYLTFKIDLYLDQFTNEAVNLMDNRQSKLSVPQLKQDYQSGRLYRISTDSTAILNEFTEKQEGQLFIDLKDFTKRTHFSKEIVVADFLSSEFYKPILDAAKKYHSNLEESNKTIKLVNLLGDAVIFSGNIESLVYLAQDIQNIFKDYRHKLKANSPSNIEQEHRERIDAQFKSQAQQIKRISNAAKSRADILTMEIQNNIKSNFKKYLVSFENDLSTKLSALENQFLDIDAKFSRETDSNKKFEFGKQKNTITENITFLRGLQKKQKQDFSKLSRDHQATLLSKFYCADLFSELAQIKEKMDSLAKKEQETKYEYEREIKKVEGFGMEAGLFISFGTAAETVAIGDDIWGNQTVDIAESINESARGTARNQIVKKMLDARINEQSQLRGKSELTYPFHVFVEKTYSFQMTPQQNAEFHASLKNEDPNQAEQILHNLLSDALKDTRDQLSNRDKTDDYSTLNVVRDIYNEGEAISEDALNAFLRETSTNRYNKQYKFPVRRFHRQILDQFLFLSDYFRFVLSTRQDLPLKDPLIFRYAGDLTFRGFEGKGSTGIYELLKFDSTFYQLILKNHMEEWLKEMNITPPRQ